MNWRTTAWLSGAALALALFIFVFERPARLAQSRAGSPPVLLPHFNPTAVTSIEVRSPGKDPVVITRTNQLWWLTSSGPHPAQQHLADALLQRVASLQGRSILSTSEMRERPSAAAEFGLNPPAITATFSSPSGPVELLLGVRSIQGNQVYCQIGGVSGIFAAPAELADLLPTEALGWRETDLFPLERLAFDRIRFDAQGAPFALARDATHGGWNLIEPRVARADPNRVGILIRQLGFLQIREFLAATSAPPRELAGLKPARLTVSLARGATEIFHVDFGAAVSNAPALYAQRPTDDELLTVPSEASELLRLSYKDLLDRRVLRFDPATLREIEFSGRDSFRVTLVSNAWHIVPANIQADPELVGRLISHLAALEIMDIAKEVVTDLDLTSYGLSPAPSRITLRTRAGDTNAVAALLETGGLKENRLFARVRGEQPVYVLNPADVESLPTAPWQLRDRASWHFDATQVTAITIRNSDLEWTIRRQGTNDWVTPPGLRNELNPFALDEALHAAGTSVPLSWVTSGTARNAALGIGRGPELTLEFRNGTNSAPLRIAFGKRTPSGNRYAATTFSDGTPMVVELPSVGIDDLWRELGLTEPASTSPPPTR